MRRPELAGKFVELPVGVLNSLLLIKAFAPAQLVPPFLAQQKAATTGLIVTALDSVVTLF